MLEAFVMNDSDVSFASTRLYHRAGIGALIVVTDPAFGFPVPCVVWRLAGGRILGIGAVHLERRRNVQTLENLLGIQQPQLFGADAVPQDAREPESDAQFGHAEQDVVHVAALQRHSAQQIQFNSIQLDERHNQSGQSIVEPKKGRKQKARILVLPELSENVGQEEADGDDEHCRLGNQSDSRLMQLGRINRLHEIVRVLLFDHLSRQNRHKQYIYSISY